MVWLYVVRRPYQSVTEMHGMGDLMVAKGLVASPDKLYVVGSSAIYIVSSWRDIPRLPSDLRQVLHLPSCLLFSMPGLVCERFG